MMPTDTYNTILIPSKEVLFKDKNSKFFGYAFPVTDEAAVKTLIQELKKQHHSARHWCYAYRLGTEAFTYRINDDGEPSNSAGQPIYGQILSFDLTNILVVVVRYFGGVKLGVGGLINAYRTAAKMALDDSSIIKRTIDKHYRITFAYKHINKVMRLIKEKQIRMINQKMELDCTIDIVIRKQKAEEIFNLFDQLHQVLIEEI